MKAEEELGREQATKLEVEKKIESGLKNSGYRSFKEVCGELRKYKPLNGTLSPETF